MVYKLRGQDAPTAKLLQLVTASFVNRDVDIVEHNGQACFAAKFVSTRGALPDIDDLTVAIWEIKPMHPEIYLPDLVASQIPYPGSAGEYYLEGDKGRRFDMTETVNYKLKKPGKNDCVDIDVLNGNTDTIDAALKEKLDAA